MMQEAIIVGILNVTPDSFSDGGLYATTERALARAYEMRQEGADYIDVGGESTRPGFIAIDCETERERIETVVKTLVFEGFSISLDTRKKELIPWALGLGVAMINFQGSVTDALALSESSEILQEDRRWVLMYNGRTDHVAHTASQELRRQLFFDRCSIACSERGISPERVIFDLGIGFGPSSEESVQLLKEQGNFIKKYPHPWMLGVSRKSFMQRWCKGSRPDQRLACNLAIATIAYQQGCRYFRVHEVLQHRECLSAAKALL